MKRKIQFIIVSLVTLMLLGGFYFLFPHVWGDMLYPLDYKDSIKKYALQYGVRPNLVAAIIYTESRFHKDSVSGAGAVGLMQIMPGTGRSIANQIGEPMGDLTDPDTNIKYGTWYIKGLLDKYPGREELAFAAYNAGVGRADRYKDTGAALPLETVGFIRKIKSTEENYNKIYDSWYAQTAPEQLNMFEQGYINISDYIKSVILGI